MSRCHEPEKAHDGERGDPTGGVLQREDGLQQVRHRKHAELQFGHRLVEQAADRLAGPLTLLF